MKTQPILIVRTVSVEKLSLLLDLCRQRWPEHPIWLVSSPNRVKELEDDARISKVIAHSLGPSGFDQPFVIEDTPEAVVFPLGNRRGGGYGNVFATFGSLKPGQFFLAPFGRELRPVSPLVLKVKYLIERGLHIVLDPLGKLTARRLYSRCGLS